MGLRFCDVTALLFVLSLSLSLPRWLAPLLVLVVVVVLLLSLESVYSIVPTRCSLRDVIIFFSKFVIFASRVYKMRSSPITVK